MEYLRERDARKHIKVCKERRCANKEQLSRQPDQTRFTAQYVLAFEALISKCTDGVVDVLLLLPLLLMLVMLKKTQVMYTTVLFMMAFIHDDAREEPTSVSSGLHNTWDISLHERSRRTH